MVVLAGSDWFDGVFGYRWGKYDYSFVYFDSVSYTENEFAFSPTLQPGCEKDAYIPPTPTSQPGCEEDAHIPPAPTAQPGCEKDAPAPTSPPGFEEDAYIPPAPKQPSWLAWLAHGVIAGFCSLLIVLCSNQKCIRTNKQCHHPDGSAHATRKNWNDSLKCIPLTIPAELTKSGWIFLILQKSLLSP